MLSKSCRAQTNTNRLERCLNAGAICYHQYRTDSAGVGESPHLRLFQHAAGCYGRPAPPLPEVEDKSHAIKILIVPLLLGYLDLSSNLCTAVSYHQSGHLMWFGLGLLFALGPAIVVSVFFFASLELFRRFLVATQLSLFFEALGTVVKAEWAGWLLAALRFDSQNCWLPSDMRRSRGQYFSGEPLRRTEALRTLTNENPENHLIAAAEPRCCWGRRGSRVYVSTYSSSPPSERQIHWSDDDRFFWQKLEEKQGCSGDTLKRNNNKEAATNVLKQS